MLKSYIYIFIEMLLIVMGINAVNTAKKYAPSKIKALVITLLTLMILRFITNIILFISQNILFLYILKFFALVNIATIPITAILTLYIFYRNDRVKFDNVISVSTLLFIAYCIAVFNMSYYVKKNQYFGYSVSFENWVYTEMVFILMVSIVLVMSFLILGRKSSNNSGLMFLIVVSVITIVEIVIKLFNLQIMPNLLVSDLSWMLVLQYALYTIKMNKGAV